jgi:hypothetical protein
VFELLYATGCTSRSSSRSTSVTSARTKHGEHVLPALAA